MPIRTAAGKPTADPIRIGKPVRLHVARRAPNGVVGGKTGVVEEHSPQCRAGVGDRVVGRGVVESHRQRCREVGRQRDVGVLVGCGWQP
jgi:hypothetical protein